MLLYLELCPVIGDARPGLLLPEDFRNLLIT